MNNNLQISTTRVRRLFNYLEDFERGNIQVPPFQRDFVWKDAQKLDLLDSIKNGYPIGSILFWRPNITLVNDLYNKDSQTIGAYFLPKKSFDSFYILDGYQRLSTLFGCLVNPLKTELRRNETEWKKNFDIVYNLEKDEFILNKKKLKLEIYEIPLYKFIDGEEFYEFQTKLIQLNIDKDKANEYLLKYKNFGTKISTYDIPSTDLTGGSIKEAVDVFSRLNSRGQIISNVWKISALSYNKEKGFRFGSQIDTLFSKLERFNFFNNKKENKRKLILQCVTNSFGEAYFDTLTKNDQNTLEKLALRNDFIATTLATFTAVEKAVNFLFNDLKVVNSKFLPYNSQLIFITDFFNKIKTPSHIKLEIIKVWFWVTTYSNYFTRYNLSKQRIAYDQFQSFIENKETTPVYYDKGEGSFETAEFPNKINFGSVRAKALALFMIKYQFENKNIELEKIGKFKIHKLFKDKGNTSENTILLIENFKSKKKKDCSDWLYSSENHDRFFITKDMKITFSKTKDKNLLLAKRKDYIIECERAFVESLGIKYIIS